MPKNNVDKNELIAVNVKNQKDVLILQNRLKATELGFNTSKIGQSLKNPKVSHKNFLWFYKKDFDELTLKRRLEIYNLDIRINYCFLYKKCNVCKKEKNWLSFECNQIKTNKSNRCYSCNSKRSSLYSKNNREKINKRRKLYLKNPLKKLRINLSNRLNFAIKSYFKTNKKEYTVKYLGCSLEFFKNYLESKFKEGMTWDNYGLYGWHIDHIIPLCHAKTEDELYELSHYTNLQPLWASENLSKNGKLKE